MPLIELELPTPAELRGGWAAFAAVCAARGWGDSAYATANQWFYHDGGGNWACYELLEAVVPGWNIAAGVAAAQPFLLNR